MIFEELTLGGGIAGLVHSFFTSTPVLSAREPGVPPGAYLHDTPEARKFVEALELPCTPFEVAHAVWQGGMYHDFLKQPEHFRAVHFTKTRHPDAFERGQFVGQRFRPFEQSKKLSSLSGLTPLSLVAERLYQVAKERRLWIDVAEPFSVCANGNSGWIVDTRSVSLRLSMFGTKKMNVAMPPHVLKLKPKQEPKLVVVQQFFVTDVELPYEMTYVADEDTHMFRVVRCIPAKFVYYAEFSFTHEQLARGLHKGIMHDVNKFLGQGGVKLQKEGEQRFRAGYETIEYDLVPSIRLLGRAATGSSLLTHDLLKDYIK